MSIRKLHYDIKREAAKISVLPSEEIDKYEYFTEDILPSDQSRTIGQARFTYSPLRKDSEKQTKNNGRSRRKAG